VPDTAMSHYFRLLDDGSAATLDGQKLAFVSQDRFVRDVCRGDCCFACLAPPGEKTFNNEHVLPDWIVGWQQLKKKEINLPDGSTHPYGTYLLPCCKACNTAMGKRFENPISHFFKTSIAKALKGPKGTARAMKSFQWMALIFVKVHLMDRKLYADGRGAFEWNDIHHAYSIARAFASGAAISSRVLGSMWALELPHDDGIEPFDYVDVTSCQTVMLRVGSNALIAVLDDCCAVLGALRLPAITWSPQNTDLQLREIVARIACANSLLRERPVFHTRWRADEGRFLIDVDLPPRPVFDAADPGRYGQILNHLLREPLGLDERADDDPVKRAVLEGRLSFLEGDGGAPATP
jgi:hypothetical protein